MEKHDLKALAESLLILYKYNDESFCYMAEHDIFMVRVSAEQLPEDSEDGKKLIGLGWHMSSEVGTWAMFT